MRIISGTFKGLHLKTDKDLNLRPTESRIREALFSILKSRFTLEGVRFLDGFCGTGMVGLEALSNGAQHATFIDKNPAHFKALTTFLQKQKHDPCSYSLIKHDLTKKLTPIKGVAYDIMFLDPPYQQNLAEQAIANLLQAGYLNRDTLLIVEEHKHVDSNSFSKEYHPILERCFGTIKLSFLKAI